MADRAQTAASPVRVATSPRRVSQNCEDRPLKIAFRIAERGRFSEGDKKCAIPSSSPAPSCLRLLLAAGLARPMQGLAYITRPTPKEPMGDTMDTPVLIARFR